MQSPIESLISLLSQRAIYGRPGERVHRQLHKWMVVLDFGEDKPPGISLCVDETPLFESDETVPQAGHVGKKPRTLFAASVSETLMELVTYARDVSQHPLVGKQFSIDGLLLTNRLLVQRRFGEPVSRLLLVTYDAYAECLRAALRPDVRTRIDATDLDRDYLEIVGRKLGLSAADKELIPRLIAEYPTASPERKWEIFHHFRKYGLGHPYEQ
jgi:hypothetical protein